LEQLDRLAREPQPRPDESAAVFDLNDGVSIDEAASFALARHPALVAARASLGVHRALVVEAGLWPDPTVAWSAVDWLVHGTSKDFLTGWSLSWSAPRPGERKARVAQAQAEHAAMRAELLEAEWRFAREVESAWLEAARLEARLATAAQRIDAARETLAFLEGARELRAATALEASIARLDLGELVLEEAKLDAARQDALSELARRLGLPAQSALELQDVAAFAERAPELDAPLDAAALAARPDVAHAQAAYEVAEREVALAATFRGAAFTSFGSALALTLPFGSRWGEAALDVALARREQSAREVEATLHEARAELESLRLRAVRAREVERVAREHFAPLVEELVQLARDARQARSAPADELLAAQSRALEALDTLVQARWEALRRAREFQTARCAPRARQEEESR
jgi:cobalt-zinc-cadmium efflux system outer membrane protein